MKRGDEKRIMLMNMVKEGKLSVDNAVQKAYGLGIASAPYEVLDEGDDSAKKSGEVFNFGVYKYSKNNKSVKCVLQIDCQEDCLSFLQRGQKQKSYSFASIKNAESADDSTSLFIQFDDATEIEIDAGSYEEKNRISRLILSIVGQLNSGQPIRSEIFAVRRKTVLKEGLLEKKGRTAAFLMWAKRHVRVTNGEILYFKLGDESDDGAALSIISLNGGIFIRKLEDNGFMLIAGKKEYTFRIPGNRHSESVEKERDDWILAIQEAAKPIAYKGEFDNASSSMSPFDQESYLKNVVRSLNQELEQLGVILNIIDAPIRASTQVKKVREIVHSLNDQIQTGLLSWTIRHADHNQTPDQAPVSPTSFPDHTYYNKRFGNEMGNASDSNNYSHLQEVSSKQSKHHAGAPDKGYNMLNLSYVQENNESEPGENGVVSYPHYSPPQTTNVYETSVQYATLSKPRKNTEDGSYYNLQNFYHEESAEAPPLPPKLTDEELDLYAGKPPSRSKVYQSHTFEHKPTNDETTVRSSPSSPVQTLTNVPVVEFKTDDIPPAPPLGAVPPPPPLPGTGAMSLHLPAKEDVIPNSKMKPLFWTKIPDNLVTSSIWKEAQDRMMHLDTSKLEKLFNTGTQSLKPEKIVAKPEKNIKPVQKTLLDPRKAQNFGIFLSGFKLSSSDIEDKLSVLDEDAGLSSEQITSLKRFQPTTEEIEMYKSFQGTINDLPSVDQFMHKLCHIPQLGKRLDVLLTVRELPDELAGIEEPIKKLMEACKTLTDNKDFVRLLEYVLSLGNYMNGGTNRGRAHGFKLSALVKLVEVRSADKKHTLLQYLTEELYETDKACLMCYKVMPELLTPIDASLKGLIAEVEIMKKDVEKLIKVSKEMSSMLSRDFLENVVQFAENYLMRIGILEICCHTTKEMSLLLKKKFGESPTADFQVWMMNVSNFMKQLQRAVESVEQKQRRMSNRKEHELKTHAEQDLKENAVVKELGENHLVSSDPTTKASGDKKSKSLPMGSPVKDAYEEVVSHTTKLKDDAPMTRVYSLKKATVIERQKSGFESDDELSFPVKSGYLEKLSGGKKRNPKWDRRHFEVTPAGYLHYSKKEDGKLSGAIYLRGLPVSVNSEDACMLIIQEEERVWKLRGENELEVLDWYNVIIYYSQMDEIEL